MGTIINPRGTSGSGKTELVRRVLAAYGWGGGDDLEAIRPKGRMRPIGYRLRHPLGGPPLAVLGDYGPAACGGCDTILLKDGGLDEVFRLTDELAATGHDVLLEGLFLSGEHQRTAELARRHSLHVIRLDTPIEHCVRNLVARRRFGRPVRRLIVHTLAAQRDAVDNACTRLWWCAASVEILNFGDALHRAQELLRLRPAIPGNPQGWSGFELAKEEVIGLARRD
jgi:hypothetical protein